MTGIAFRGKSFKLLNLHTLFIFGIMAFPTSQFRMYAIQFEIGPIVIERHCTPIRFIMTFRAIRLSIVFYRNKTLMLVFVTVHAFFANVAEMPAAVLFVTGIACRGFVRTRKLELGSIVPFQGIGGSFETIVVVAFTTVRGFTVYGELTLVDFILMAVRTFTVFKRLGHIARFVALLAFQQTMLSQKRKISLVMIEDVPFLNDLERRFLMAFLTVLTEFIFVYILVTGIAIGISQILESLPDLSIHHFILVAFRASQRFMFS